MELKLYPDKVLRRRCQPVREVDDEVLLRAEQMLQLMYETDGVGLAGPQVAWPRQIITLDTVGEHQDPRIFVNPRIVAREGYIEMEEGCLSLPGVRARVPRAEKVAVVAFTILGERIEAEAEGLAAVAWQHELDHLNGVLLIDRLSPTQLLTLREELKRLEHGTPEAGEGPPGG
jgi:peptide deformylase